MRDIKNKFRPLTIFIVFALLSLPTQSFAESVELKKIEIDQLRVQLCNSLMQGLNDSEYSIPENFESRLLSYGRISKNERFYKLKVAEFWNSHNDEMICPPRSGLYPDQHLYKRAFEPGVEKELFLNYLLVNRSEFPIDVNAVEILPNGKRSTVLDYIEAVLARPDQDEYFNIGQVRGIRSILIKDFGAKLAEELPN